MTKPAATAKDLPGISPTDPRADWYVGPVGHHRDSDLVEESNWHVAIEALRETGEEHDSDHPEDGGDWQILRFRHWAVGWVEEVITRPGSRAAEVATELRERLEDYPILSDDHHDNLVHEAEEENMSSILKDITRDLVKVFEARDVENNVTDREDFELEEWLDKEECQDMIADYVRSYGETDGEGWIKLRGSSLDRLADKLVEKYGDL